MTYRRLCLVLLLGLLAPLPAYAQATRGWDPAQLHMTRAELQTLLQNFEQASGSDAYSQDLRRRARSEAALVRARLDEGDFQVGDQVALLVEGEQALSNVFIVQQGRTLTLPLLGEIPLAGVLRSELEDHLAGQLGRFIHEPRVRAQSLIRISVTGSVGKPGFYVVPTEQVLTDALMAAGGPSPASDLKKIAIERGDRRIWEGHLLQQAITEGRTFDQLNLRAGDRIVVPYHRPSMVSPQALIGLASGLIYVAGRAFRWF
jgi:hypothetical protein